MNAPVLFAHASGHDIKLSWSPVEGAIGYELFRGLVPNPTNLRDTIPGGKRIMYFDVAGSGVRHYRMRALGANGKSPYSNDVRVVVVS